MSRQCRPLLGRDCQIHGSFRSSNSVNTVLGPNKQMENKQWLWKYGLFDEILNNFLAFTYSLMCDRYLEFCQTSDIHGTDDHNLHFPLCYLDLALYQFYRIFRLWQALASCNTSPASSTTSSTVSSISVKQEPNNNVSQNVANFLTIKTELPDPHFNDSQNTTNFKVTFTDNSYQICLNLMWRLVRDIFSEGETTPVT